MQARMPNPAMTVPGAMQAMLALSACAEKSGVPKQLIDLISLRASQINGCGFCVDMHAYDLKAAGETDLRIAAVAAWRDAPYFTDAERAALALAEAATRLSDRPDPVPDDVWKEATRHYDQATLSGLVIAIAMINAWNRINVTIRQVAGAMRAEKKLDAVGAGTS
jgi:AhpD family alkylhydroperoxidase